MSLVVLYVDQYNYGEPKVCRYSRQVRLFLQQVKRYKTAGQAPKNGRLGAIKWQVTCHYLQQQVQFFFGRSFLLF